MITDENIFASMLVGCLTVPLIVLNFVSHCWSLYLMQDLQKIMTTVYTRSRDGLKHCTRRICIDISSYCIYRE